MSDAELEAELARVRAKLAKGKRALKAVMGQARLTNQLLSDLDDEFHSLQRRLDERKAKEAQQHEHRDRIAVAR